MLHALDIDSWIDDESADFGPQTIFGIPGYGGVVDSLRATKGKKIADGDLVLVDLNPEHDYVLFGKYVEEGGKRIVKSHEDSSNEIEELDLSQGDYTELWRVTRIDYTKSDFAEV